MDLKTKKINEIKNELNVLNNEFIVYEEMDKTQREVVKNDYDNYNNIINKKTDINIQQLGATMYASTLGFLKDYLGVNITEAMKEIVNNYVNSNVDDMFESNIKYKERCKEQTFDEFIKEHDDKILEHKEIINDCLSEIDIMLEYDSEQVEYLLMNLMNKLEEL